MNQPQVDQSRYIYNVIPEYPRSLRGSDNRLDESYVRAILERELKDYYGAAIDGEAGKPQYDAIVLRIHEAANRRRHEPLVAAVTSAEVMAHGEVAILYMRQKHLTTQAPWRMTNEEFAAALASFEGKSVL